MPFGSAYEVADGHNCTVYSPSIGCQTWEKFFFGKCSVTIKKK